MLLLIHILIAFSSLLTAGFAWLRPSSLRLNVSYGLVLMTVITGTVLTFQLPSHLLQSCVAGLMYLGAVFTAIIAARSKLAQE